MTGQEHNGAAVRKPSGASWLREQALAQQAARAAKDEKVDQTKQAAAVLQELLVNVIKMQQRMQVLARWHADRCERVIELRQELKTEWERRVAAEAEVESLRAHLSETPPNRVRAKATKEVAAAP